jgi:hypothetical protein
MHLRSFRIGILCSIALLLLPFSRSAVAESYCPGCKAEVIGAAIGVGAGIGAGIYFIHHSHLANGLCAADGKQPQRDCEGWQQKRGSSA